MNKELLKKIALKMIKEKGLINLQCEKLCERAGIARGSFDYIIGCGWTVFYDELKKIAPDITPYKVTKSRIDPELRKKHILDIALVMAAKVGYHNLTRDGIANKANMSTGIITQRFGTIGKLKNLVLRTAIQQEILCIIAQGLANNDPQTQRLPKELKEKTLQSML